MKIENMALLQIVGLALLASSSLLAMTISGFRLNQVDSSLEVVAEGFHLRFPTRDVEKGDTYQFIKLRIPYDAFTITSISPEPTFVGKTHHFTLWLCSGSIVGSEGNVVSYEGGGEETCKDRFSLVGFDNMDGNQKPTTYTFPPGFGTLVGREAFFTHAMIEIHFNAPCEADTSAFIVAGIAKRQPGFRQVSSLILSTRASSPPLPPGKDAVTAKIHPMVLKTAARLLITHFHFHKYGTSIQFNAVSSDGKTTYFSQSYVRAISASNTVIVDVPLPAGAVLKAQCVYNTTSAEAPINTGFKSTDEMCNVFIVAANQDASCDATKESCTVVARDVLSAAAAATTSASTFSLVRAMTNK